MFPTDKNTTDENANSAVNNNEKSFHSFYYSYRLLLKYTFKNEGA